MTCPNGHQSQDPEWCDTCGAKLGAAPTPSPPPPPPPSTPEASVVAGPPPVGPAAGAGFAAPSADCPHCGARNEAEALFCEGCGYDFTTGQAPPPTEEGDVVVSAPATGVEPVGWVIIVEVDPTWYDLRGELAGEPCPPPTSSTIQLTGATALIGRTSRTHRVYPEIALDGDTGVSRRHASSSTPPRARGRSSTSDRRTGPTSCRPVRIRPPTARPSRSLADRDAIYLGAWTKLTLRDAGDPTASGTA
jgi:hypothetical protein